MRSRRPTPEHEQAVARRLALLSAELAAVQSGQAVEGERARTGGPGSRSDTGFDPGFDTGHDRGPDTGHDAGPGAGSVADEQSAWPWGEHTRIRGGTSAGPLEHEPRAEDESQGLVAHQDAFSLPVPGRHAARRGVTGWVPAGLRGHLRLQPAHLALVATAVAIALGWTAWWVVSGQPQSTAAPHVDPTAPAVSPVAAPAEGGVTAAGETGGLTGAVRQEGAPQPGQPGQLEPSGQAGTGGQVVVDVAGRVRRPGIAVLPAGSRVVDALEAAGGARRGVDLTGLNLARPLVDGEQILVGVRVPGGSVGAGGSVPTAGPGGAPAAGALVSLNQADQATLETLPGVGPVTAAAIISWRTAHGGFSAVEELIEVDGIGEATLAKLAPLVTL